MIHGPPLYRIIKGPIRVTKVFSNGCTYNPGPSLSNPEAQSVFWKPWPSLRGHRAKSSCVFLVTILIDPIISLHDRKQSLCMIMDQVSRKQTLYCITHRVYSNSKFQGPLQCILRSKEPGINIPGPKSHQISRLHDLKADLSLRGWAAAAAVNVDSYYGWVEKLFLSWVMSIDQDLIPQLLLWFRVSC